ncbi:MAG: hypothetical protein BWX96_03070 [Bacteroidetes bacterium ADurb.Bin145]|jgi:tetrahydromethanopterin S-methyltransferase subunit G|nr:MAG: hypothetical protein BWX96_03070 [Bacteroidetes bacterium ADurb.Bin145]
MVPTIRYDFGIHFGIHIGIILIFYQIYTDMSAIAL